MMSVAARHLALLALTALMLVMTLPSAALAYSIQLANQSSGGPIRWGSTSVPYQLHAQCSVDLPTNVCLNEVRESFAAWSANCSALNMYEAGTSATKQVTSVGYGTNGLNEVAWIEDSQWVFGSYVLGVTSPVFSVPSGEISEADIAFNGYQHTWQVDGQPYSTDVMNVAVHEIGHFFGLQHVLNGYDPNDPPTMATTADNQMKSRTPEPDDLDGLCFLYPSGTWTCSSNADCPLLMGDNAQGEVYVGQLVCDNGSCGGISNEIPEGTGQMGDACVGDYDCIPSLFCQPLQGSQGICTQECQTNSPNCPSGFECVGYSNSPNLGVCLEASGSSGGSSGGSGQANGSPCNSSVECASSLCVGEASGGVCRAVCNDDSDCLSGESCYPIPGTNYGACVPNQGGSGGGDLKANGEICQSGNECQSGICAGDGNSYVCVQPCSTNDDCPSGYECYGLSGGGGACFESAGSDDSLDLGDACETSQQCASELCIQVQGLGAFCSAECTSASACPCGMTCEQFTDGGYCTPGEKLACVPDGEACVSDSECTSGTCFEGLCLETCSIFQGSGPCADGEVCQRLAPDTTLGTCQPAGSKQDGGACGQDNACASGFCYAYYCHFPCSPFSPDMCPVGQICETVAPELGVCVTPPEGEPDPGLGSGAGGTGAGGTTEPVGETPAAEGPVSGDAYCNPAAPDCSEGLICRAVDDAPEGGYCIVDTSTASSSSSGGCASAAPSDLGLWLAIGVLIGLFRRSRRRALVA